MVTCISSPETNPKVKLRLISYVNNLHYRSELPTKFLCRILPDLQDIQRKFSQNKITQIKHFTMTSTEELFLKNLDEMAKTSNCVKISPDDPKYKNYTHCSHAMIYARTKSKSLNIYDTVAIILMQMRFDGFIGFPGGGVDPGESPVEAVNREIKEESGWWEENGLIKDSDYQFTHANDVKKQVLHFFATEVSESKIAEIERNSLKAPDFGEEVLGNFRVPLYTMKDSYRGFPAFLTNCFVGNAKAQLLECLVKLNIMSPDCVLLALESKPTT